MKKITLVFLISLPFLATGFSQSQYNFEDVQKDEYKQVTDSLIVDTIFSRLDMHNKKYNWAMDKGNDNEQSINTIIQSLEKLSTQMDELQKKQSEKIDRLVGIVQTNKENIEKTTEGFDNKIENSDDAISKKIDSIDQTVNKGSIYWIIGLIVVALLAIILYILLRNQMIKQKVGLDSNIQDARKKIEDTRRELEEEAMKLDGKLVEVLNTQLKLMQNQKEDLEEIPKLKKETDHSLVLKVADRLISMEKNLSRMDEKTKGLKNLKKAIQSIKDNFASNDYEIVEMIGKPFDEGMKASVTYNPDSEEKPGIITRIIKPQVNYKGEMIQPAQIEVSE